MVQDPLLVLKRKPDFQDGGLLEQLLCSFTLVLHRCPKPQTCNHRSCIELGLKPERGPITRWRSWISKVYAPPFTQTGCRLTCMGIYINHLNSSSLKLTGLALLTQLNVSR